MADQKKLVARLIDVAGQTFAEQAGIRLADKPSPLYRLLVLSVLLSTRIKADIAVAAAAELGKTGMTTPQKMIKATWQQRVDALGRAHYVRYDESTATALGDGAQFLQDEYRGDLRRLRDTANGDLDTLHELLQKFPRLGPVGADIFCREVQSAWPEVLPYFDGKTLDGAKRIGLTTDLDRLARLVGGEDQAKLAAALVRVSLDKHVADEVRRS